MTSFFKTALSLDSDWAHAAQTCCNALIPLPEGVNLGFVYATDHLADDLSSILTYLRQKTGIAHWLGTIGLGVHVGGHEVFDRPALAVMAGALPTDSFHAFQALKTETTELPAAVQAWIAERRPTFGVVHGDPTNEDIPAILEALAEDLDVYLVGGLTSSRQANYAIADAITGGGLSGVLFAPEVGVITGQSQGCAPLAGPHLISDCLDNVIVGLDGRPALDVLRDDVGELLARDLQRLAGYVHAALPVEGSDTGDYMVRDLLAIDPGRGWIAIGATVQPGERLMFVRRDPQSARDDLIAMLDRLKARLPGPPKAGLYVSCVARGPRMFGCADVESGLIRERLGEFPLVGFFAGGEISHNRLYGYTGVLTLFV